MSGRSRSGDAVRTLLRGVGQVLITLGLVLLLFVGYELQVTGLYTQNQQEALADELDRALAQPTAPAQRYTVPKGAGLARIHAPRLGRSFSKVVVEGTSVDDLRKGPGHYVGTAGPGEVGNVAIAGHRTTYGAPFNRIDELRAGDPIVLETPAGWFTYRVRSQEVVPPSRVEVTLPVPNRPGAKPTERLLTLTTCHPKYSARTRLIVYAALSDTRPRAEGPPADLVAMGAPGGT